MSIGQNTAATERLTSFLERLEHLLDEIDGLKENLKDLKAEVRDEGFNVAAVLRLVAIRRDKRRASQENERSTTWCCTLTRRGRHSTSPSPTRIRCQPGQRAARRKEPFRQVRKGSRWPSDVFPAAD
ncbi:GapR family DNA-binding domain-containing protein [Defluviicoccus vanus]|uniref:DUF2312 domain-containing protein n=1 Tax=Defluviicoccus vanus TaxID=111831 RepID=A0A7H1N493_9PROT|nr:GapR family DNA-binding domain-containing protein [Defluviicoccus vanus]QNT70529.1 DUF2312 domain-containing protein [Defluviicoccus vanus]